MKKIQAKPFSVDFDTQLEVAEELYGIQQHFCFEMQDVKNILQNAAEFYPEEVCRRVESLLRMQMRKYAYLLKE